MKYTRLVEKYLDGELSGEELRKFELEILKNPEVAEEVERIRNLNAFARKQYSLLTSAEELLEDPDISLLSIDESVVRDDLETLKIHRITEMDHDYQDFRKKVKAVSLKNYLKTTAKSKILIPGYAIWLAAACFILLLTFPLLNILTSREPENLHNVYTSFYEPYRADLLVRNKTSVPDDRYKKGLNEYMNSNYRSALSYFNEAESEDILNNSIYLLKGICLMETGNYEPAILTFNNLSNNPVLKDHGQWYTGLCFLELKQSDKAREIFREMSRREGYYKNMSKKVLKKL
jgi:hypothetical protein